MRISDWSSDVCSSDLHGDRGACPPGPVAPGTDKRFGVDDLSDGSIVEMAGRNGEEGAGRMDAGHKLLFAVASTAETACSPSRLSRRREFSRWPFPLVPWWQRPRGRRTTRSLS